MHPCHSITLAFFLLQLLLLHAGSNYAQSPPQGETTISPTVEVPVVGSQSVSVNSTNTIIESTTVVPGATAITVDHTATYVNNSVDILVDQSTPISGLTFSLPERSFVATLSSSLNLTTGASIPPAGITFRGTISSSQSSTINPSSTSSSPSPISGSSRLTGARIDSGSFSLPAGTGNNSSNGNGSSIGPNSTRFPIPAVGSSFSYRSAICIGSCSPSLPSRTRSNGKSISISSVGSTTPVNSASLSSISSAKSVDSTSSSFFNGSASVTSSSSINFSPSGSVPTSQSSLQSKPGTASITSTSIATPLPGSTRVVSSAPTTSNTGALTATSGAQSISVITNISGTKVLGVIPPTLITITGSGASSQESQYGAILTSFVNGGRSWVNEITLPAVKTQALEEVRKMLENTKDTIKNLGGDFPPSSNKCSNAGKRTRFFDPLEVVDSLAQDALGLANCIGNILNDISSKIGPPTGPPPSLNIIPEIKIQLNALKRAGEEEAENVSSTSNKQSSTGSSTDISSASSSRSLSTRSSSSSSGPGACPTYSYPSDDTELWEGISDDSIGAQKRSFAKAKLDQRHIVAKRDRAKPVTAINSCSFPNSIQIFQPSYSGLEAFKKLGQKPNLNKGANGKVFNSAVKWYAAHRACGTSPSFSWYRTVNQGSNDIPSGSSQSIDHVYEKQLITLFLKSQIGTAAFTCDDMEKVFFPSSLNRMQKIYDQLPGMQFSTCGGTPMNINSGFAGLEQSINGIKGYMFDRGIMPPSRYFTKSRLASTSSMIGAIQDLIMLFGIIKDSDFQSMYDVTNNRVYSAFVDIDNFINIKKFKKANGTLMPSNWASNYKAWMTQYLIDIAADAWNWASTTHNNLDAMVNADMTLDPVTKADQLKLLSEIQIAPGFSQADFICDFGLTWQTVPLTKRDLEGLNSNIQRDGVCLPDSQSRSSATTAGSSSTQSSSVPFPIPVPTTLQANSIPPPVQSSSAPSGTCNCSEKDCTADSPACCANGSCVSQTVPASAPASSVSALPPPYVPGICSFHLTETEDCKTDDENLYAIINLKDGARNDIGDTDVSASTDGIGNGINAGDAYTFDSKLPYPLVITGEHNNDYVQFTYGGLSWQSRTPNGGGSCNVGGWDPREGPSCDSWFGFYNAVQHMDCFFPC